MKSDLAGRLPQVQAAESGRKGKIISVFTDPLAR
ncbi:hypothetical protein predicted by Glimmer/Critica [Acetobacter senegalensis]|uniref:Uncharacterized protein n=1 Tax=Acetobacter senegalensis TaxID=446692 RepID=A0A0U5ES58_9PROT|nr:hypothetical protein predicted by Glimmer/Critica [Acetobacter senegalensis]